MSQGCCDEGVQRPRLPRKYSEVTTSALFWWKEAYQRDQGHGDSAGGPSEAWVPGLGPRGWCQEAGPGRMGTIVEVKLQGQVRAACEGVWELCGEGTSFTHSFIHSFTGKHFSGPGPALRA